MADLSSLTPAERHVLAMVGEGHTAKSIAAATGASVHAVNERLRSARRKTGAGSSRELARLLRSDKSPQENRDDSIGIAQADIAPPQPPAPPPRSRTAMIALALLPVAALAGALFSQQAPGAAPRVIATSPAQGASVPAGTVTIRVTFDQPMRGTGYSFVNAEGGMQPNCNPAARVLADRRSFEVDCATAPGHYAIGFNSARFRNFVGQNGVPAVPAVLRFSTR
jgi:DNA-binding CsgD family transcriptional regulator